MSAFEEYGKEFEEDFKDSQEELNIQNKLIESFGLYRYLGQIVEVFLPKMFGVFAELTKGKDKEADARTTQKNDPRVK